MMGGEWEDDGRNPQKFLMQSGRISVQPAQEVVSADSRSGMRRVKKWYQPTPEVLSADSRSAISRPNEHRLPNEKEAHPVFRVMLY